MAQHSVLVDMAERLRAALADAAQDTTDRSASIVGLQRLSGGANMETWSFDLVTAGATEPLILRRLPGGAGTWKMHSEQTVGELSLADEAELITIAGRHGVPVPAVRLVLRGEHALGQGYIMSREQGEALPFRLLADERYRSAREQLAFQCGQTLGRIHQIPLAVLPTGLADHSGALLFQRAQLFLDTHGNGSPVLQLGLNWLRDNPRRNPLRTLVHGDFRNGNLLVDDNGLVAVLDWELAHLGDPVQDLGYITRQRVALWRGATGRRLWRVRRPAGWLCVRHWPHAIDAGHPLLAGACGPVLGHGVPADAGDVPQWPRCQPGAGCGRAAPVGGRDRSVGIAGRRICVSGTEGVELLEAVRQFLRQEVLPELDGFKAYNTRVAANALGIVAREMAMGAGLAELDAQIAATLGLDASAGAIPQQIALALRDGTLVADERVLSYLKQRTLLSIAIDNPKYSGLQQARALFG